MTLLFTAQRLLNVPRYCKNLFFIEQKIIGKLKNALVWLFKEHKDLHHYISIILHLAQSH